MNTDDPPQRVERLFPFVLRARSLLIGRETLTRSKSRLQFVLMTRDISENSRAQVLADFAHYPVVECYQASDLETFFNIRGAKVIGFAKSDLAKSIYAEMKEWRVNKPPAAPAKSAEAPPAEEPVSDKNVALPKPDTGSSKAPAATPPRARWNQAERDARRLRK